MKKLQCYNDDCGYSGRPIIKMGGLLCRKCRVILKEPGTPEYKLFLKEIRDKIGKG